MSMECANINLAGGRKGEIVFLSNRLVQTATAQLTDYSAHGRSPSAM